MTGQEVQVNVQTDEEAEGSAEQPEINWTAVEVPDDVIMNHPAYKKLLAESIKRKEQIRELKNSVPKQEHDDAGESQVETQQVDVNSIASIILEQIKPQLEQFQAVANSIAAKDQEVKARSLQSTYNLTKEDTTFMQELPVEQWEKYAQRVGTKVEGDQFGGDGGSPTKRNRFIERYQKDRGAIENPEDIEAFNPSTHERLSGGAVINK